MRPRTHMAVALIGLAVALAPGCAILEGEGSAGEEFAVRSAIQLATVKVIDGDPERAERVQKIAGEARALVSDDHEAALERIEAEVRDEIQWNRLSPTEEQVASDLIELVRAELEARIGEGVLQPDDRVAVRTVLDWIIEAAGRAAAEGDDAVASEGLADPPAVASRRVAGEAPAARVGPRRGAG